MKKLLSILLIAAMMLSIASFAAAEDNWKIAVVTGTVSQGEEEFRAAEQVLEKYGPEHIVLGTYPDNFMSEMETTVSELVSFASDPEVKAIVMCQAVPGAKAGFEKIREMGRDDILLIAGTAQEDPADISAASDIVLYADEAMQGDLIMEKLAEWGVDVFIHYSFPRHMAMEMIVARHNLLKANADALGIEMVDVTAPDPTAEAGLSASQQFILEDVPQQMAKYEGKKVAFFTTNCGMQPSLQAAVLKEPNAYYPLPCCPSPYHAFPATLGLELKVGSDNEEALRQIAKKLNEKGAVDRFSTWAEPVNMTIINVGVDYAIKFIKGEISERNNEEMLNSILSEKAQGAKFIKFVNAEGIEFDNYYVVALPMVNFADYL
jgi:ABC-type sugar transport system substrate-binding protein